MRTIVVGLPTFLVAVAAAWFATVAAIASSAPEQTLRIAPGNWLALTNKAAQLLETGESATLPQVASLSKAALSAQALNPQAVGDLAYALSDTPDQARFLADLSERLSRRDFAVQLWLIEDRVGQGNVRDALRHYDIALRTIADASQVLIPTLLDAAKEGPIRAALVPYVRDKAPWTSALFQAGLNDDGQLLTIANLWRAAGDLPEDPVSGDVRAQLLTRLADTGHLDQVADLYRRLPGADPKELTSVGVTPVDEAQPTRFAKWRIVAGANSGGDIVRSDRGYGLSAFVNSESNLVVARKILFLMPGSYLLTARTAADGGAKGSISFQLRCPTSSQGVVAQSKEQLGNIALPIEIPADCIGQYLEIVAHGSAGAQGFQAITDSLALRRQQSIR